MKNYWNKFTENFGSTIIHPQFIMNSIAYEAINEARKHAKGKFIDIGCGRMPYRKQLEPYIDTYTGVDNPKTASLYTGRIKPDILASAEKLPLKDNEFDSAINLQVLEYIENPLVAMKEISRILKKNGVLVITSPFLYPIHDIPHDRNRFTDTALREMLEKSGFSIVSLEAQGGFLEFWLQSLNVFIFKRIQYFLRNLNILSFIYILVLIPTGLILTPLINTLVVIIRTPIFRGFSKYPNLFPMNYLVVAKKN